MPRPQIKEELLRLSTDNYVKLMNTINFLPKNELQKVFPPSYLNRNVKDVLAHLHHWHLLFLEWYTIGMTGAKPDMPAKGYTWKTLPDLNREIQGKYRAASLTEVRKLLDESFNTLQKLIKNHSEKELFEKKKYHWTGSTSLAAYLISATSSHYDWALKLIKKCTKK